MTALESNLVNAFETTLSSQLASGATTMALTADPGVAAPVYFVIDPDNDSTREVVKWTSGAYGSATVTRDIDSTHGTDPTHASGSVVRLAVVKQHIDDVHDSIQQGFVLEDDDGTEVTIAPSLSSGVYTAREVKFIGDGVDIDWTDTSTGSDGDPYDLTFTLDINDLSAGTVAVANDSVVILDSDDNASKKESIADIVTAIAGNGLSATSGVLALDLSEASAGVVNVANDSIVIIDADDSNAVKKESVADLIAAIDGTGLTASSGVLAVDTSQAITALTGGDLTIYDDQNNADVSLKMGTSATEALSIEVLNGGSNKTAEEVKIKTSTASSTANHGKISVYIDDAEILDIDDGGIDLASGMTFAINGSDIATTDTTYTAGDLIDFDGTQIDVDLSEAAEAAVANGDYLLFLDGGATGTAAKEAVHDLATLFAGTGLTASSSVIGVDTSQAITALTGGDLTIYDDANNADVSFKMGTSATEAFSIEVLNGGSNKTAEEIKISTSTASSTGNHGKISIYIDDTEILDIDDGGIDLASGMTFAIDGSNLPTSDTNTTYSAGDGLTLSTTTFSNDVIGKQSMWIPAAAMSPTASNGCAAIAAVETTAGRPDMYVLDFDASSDENAQFSVAMPSYWNEGTVTYQVYWTTAATDTDGVAWSVAGVAVSDNDTIDVAYGTAVVVTDDALGAAEDLMVTAESGAITIAGSPAAGDLCYFNIERDVSDGNDDMAEDARLIGLKLFYTIDDVHEA